MRAPAVRFSIWAVLAVVLIAALLSAGAVWFVWRQGWTLYSGDAESHLNIARRIVDSRTPGYGQIGTGWLPLLHLLILPFVSNDFLWRTGLAGAIPAASCFVAGVTFLFAAARRVLNSTGAGVAAAGLYALNPNALYLQSTPMNEPIFFAALAALLYFTIRFRETQSLGYVAAAGIVTMLGSLARYEAWFLIPFVTAYFLLAARRRRWWVAFLFGAIASFGPALWVLFNWWVFSNALEFYSGPASAKAIQRGLPYPGKENWQLALTYFGWAVRACAGAPLFFIGAAGLLAALWKRAIWPVLLLLLPGVFYVWSMHSSASTPIHLPNLPPHSYYNTRYGITLLPLLAFCSAAMVALFQSGKRRKWLGAAAVLVILGAASFPWIRDPRPEAWITWKEAQTNSVVRRQWTLEATQFLAPRYHPGDGIITSFGDYTAIFRAAGIPLRDTLTGDNGPQWEAATLRPDLFLWEQWALVEGGDPVQTAVNRARRHGPNFELVRQVRVKYAPVIEIYERHTAPSNLLQPHDENPIP